MPSKIPAEAEIESDEEMMGAPMGYPEMLERKNYLWSCDLQGDKAQHKFEGGDSETETIKFMSAALGEGATGKHVIKVSAVDANSEKTTAILCILNDTNCWVRLPALTIEPPLLLSLAEGKGPVNICANHLLEEDPEDMEDEDEESAEAIGAGDAPMKVEGPKAASPKVAKVEKKTEDQKKRKANDDAPTKESPVTKKAKPEKKDKKNRNYESIDDVKKAIIANPGGKPKKEEKFGNWVKNTMKCTNEDWIKDLWAWHKTENNIN